MPANSKTWKVFVMGSAATGKTSLLEQLIYGSHIKGSAMSPTIEDIYIANIETDRSVKERVRFYDTAPVDLNEPELQKQYVSYADGIVLIYDVTSWDSFHCINKLKKEIDKNREKKELTVLAIGNKIDLYDCRQVDAETATKWALKEKVKLYETSVDSRQSIAEAFIWLTSKMSQPPNKSSFTLRRKQPAPSATDT